MENTLLDRRPRARSTASPGGSPSPQRTDIVVFHPPFDGPVLIKRIIGMPGDEVSLSDGAVYINGKRARRAVRTQVERQECAQRAVRQRPPLVAAEPYTVPAGSYFVMGDNRIDSGDSREFGPVKRAQLVGKAFALYWPPDRIGGTD